MFLNHKLCHLLDSTSDRQASRFGLGQTPRPPPRPGCLDGTEPLTASLLGSGKGLPWHPERVGLKCCSAGRGGVARRLTAQTRRLAYSHPTTRAACAPSAYKSASGLPDTQQGAGHPEGTGLCSRNLWPRWKVRASPAPGRRKVTSPRERGDPFPGEKRGRVPPPLPLPLPLRSWREE